MILKHISSPDYFISTIYLVGAASETNNWHQRALNIIDGWSEPSIVYTPSKEVWGGSRDKISEQSLWESNLFKDCDYVLFWFSEDTLCPMSLFKLGGQLEIRDETDLFVGCDIGYYRKSDLESQLELKAGYGPILQYSLEDTLEIMHENILSRH